MSKLEEPKSRTILRMGAGKRHFNVQRKIGEGLVTEAKETFVPDALLNDIISKKPNLVEAAIKELHKIMMSVI